MGRKMILALWIGVYYLWKSKYFEKSTQDDLANSYISLIYYIRRLLLNIFLF